MPPAKKRAKIDETVSLERLNGLFDDLIANINDVESSSATLLTLKSVHEQLLEQLDQKEAMMNEKLEHRKRFERRMAGLRYERQYLEQKIQALKSYATPHLTQLARDEAKSGVSDEQALKDYLLGSDVSDPMARQDIINCLHKELHSRGGLERDLIAKQNELKDLQAKLQAKRKFLDELPDHLATIERASMPLQRFMRATPVARQIGSDRQARLERAKSLPAPLFTVFQQLQQYLDQNDDSMNVSITGTGEESQVLLQLPVPDVATHRDGRFKKVTIHFHYQTQGLDSVGTVSAIPSGCGSTLNQAILLNDLFPDDSPDPLADSQAPGRPYQWCNYLAGLHKVSEAPRSNCTRAILRQIQRRVRANATLKYILHSLQRLVVPTPPMDNGDRPQAPLSCKLAGFDAQSDNLESSDVSYVVTLRSASQSLMVQVRVNSVRYPEVPPTWSLQPAIPESPTPLYDERLAELEHQVNAKLLENLCETDKKDEQYEWILVHQLCTIMETWSKWLDENN